LELIKPSATMAVTEKATALRAQGVDLIDFGAGEPDFDTPEPIKYAAVEALRAGKTKYTPVGGTDELKTAIVTKLRRDNGLTYEKREVIASCGGKHALFVAFQVLFNPGDEVIVPGPFWVSYPDMLLLAGAQANIVLTRADHDFKMTPEELDAAITPRTRHGLRCPRARRLAGRHRPATRHRHHLGRRVRDDGVRRLQGRPRAPNAPGAAPAYALGELGVEDLRHDRLARRLHRRSRACD
jgi:hypothetical protein